MWASKTAWRNQPSGIVGRKQRSWRREAFVPLMSQNGLILEIYLTQSKGKINCWPETVLEAFSIPVI